VSFEGGRFLNAAPVEGNLGGQKRKLLAPRPKQTECVFAHRFNDYFQLSSCCSEAIYIVALWQIRK
jgi:hypothetical protein